MPGAWLRPIRATDTLACTKTGDAVASDAVFINLGAKEFFRRYPVNYIDLVPDPPGLPGALGAALPPRIKGDPVAGQGSVNKFHRVRYVTFSARREDLAQITSARCPNPVKISVGSAVTAIPAFYLPYQNDHNFRITLSAAGPSAANVDFFLTELVDGCSVYVEGTVQTPTAYHINAANYADNSDRPTSLANLATAAGVNLGGMSPAQKHQYKFGLKSANMDNRFQNDGAHRPKAVVAGVGVSQARKVENDDYMLRPDSTQEDAFNLTLPALQTGHVAPTQAGTKSVDAMRCITTQGFVFGIRTGGAWKFYVQRKALVEYFHRSRHLFGKATLTSLGKQWIVREVVQFWPAAKTGSNA